ncbi:NAD(P)-dependent oxidoreductase [Rhodococcus sp. NPDC003318]|uniref:NAD(P)-dependent oxidoreductase n=1 Tax=Rhodococcus sp. NPDC003318 TaxID=3364503 RepID=UPI0036900B62
MPETSNGHIAFVGLGNMGAHMSRRLVESGFQVVGFDLQEAARRSFAETGGTVVATSAEAVAGAGIVILMLPNSTVVESVLNDVDVLGELASGTIVIDMGSSEPTSTRRVALELAERGVNFVDAPVSGGIGGAAAGTLTIMAAGNEATVAQLSAMLAPLGTWLRVGDIGAGHALKAINNLLAAVQLLATAEGFAIGRRFGLDPEVIVSTINAASGRSAASETKFPNFVLPETYDSGFALRLMLKDMRIATGLAAELGIGTALGDRAVQVWSQADTDLGPGADQMEIARWALTGTEATSA